MKKGLLSLIVGGGILLFLVTSAISSYNSLVGMDVAIDNAWSQVEVDYQRRFDLIPNLVSTVQGVADFEKETYTAVTEARSAWAQANEAGDREGQIEASNTFDSALSRLLVTVENYPQLRAQESFQDLQVQIEGTENRIATSRRDYNQAVEPYNRTIREFPTVLFAMLFGFDEQAFFEAAQGAETAPAVEFN